MKRLNKLKTLAVKAFETLGGGALRQFLSKEVSKLVCKEEINHKFLLTYLPTNLLTRKRRVAFTLAEVLITLGVIGVVAAITIPTIAKNYYKHTVEVQLAKTYEELKEAIIKSELDNGSYRYWNYNMNKREFVQKYIMPYLDENYEPCNKCFKNKRFWYTPNGTYFSAGHINSAPMYKYNGRSIVLYQHYEEVGTDRSPVFNPEAWNYHSLSMFVQFFIDVDGDKGPSIMGKDVFTFSLLNYTKGSISDASSHYYGLYPGTPSSGRAAYKHSDNDIYSECANYPNSECSVLLHRNNWKFPKNYPIKF